MVAPAVDGIDLFKIVGRSISGWVPSFKMGTASQRKTPTLVTSQRWAMEKTIWEVVGGERK